MTTTHQIAVSYFGKVPSRGDFVKASHQVALMQVLDTWMTEAMHLLAQDPRWKMHYDETRPVDFAFMGYKNHHVVAGHLIPSHDSAQRRFPFLTLGTLEAEWPNAFIAASPLILSRLWSRLGVQAQEIIHADDSTGLLHTLANTPFELNLPMDHFEMALQDYLHIQSLGSLQRMLESSGFRGHLRQALLALGLLLQPIIGAQEAHLDKSLVLPLPVDTVHRNLVGAFWMSLITPFLEKSELELILFVGHVQQLPSLIIGFGGASPGSLEAIFSPMVSHEHHITLTSSEWVESQLEQDYGLNKLSSYLAQSELSLHSAVMHFNTTFLGA